MSLEQEIKQAGAFRNDYQKTIVNIIYTYNWMTEKQKAIFDLENITLQQYNILRILKGAHPNPLSTNQIRDRMLDKMSDTSRIVDRMIAKKLVIKQNSVVDKRLVDIFIAEEGMLVLDRLAAYNDKMDDILEALSPEDLVTLNALLDKIRSNNNVI